MVDPEVIFDVVKVIEDGQIRLRDWIFLGHKVIHDHSPGDPDTMYPVT
jgi:hypothetical protein